MQCEEFSQRLDELLDTGTDWESDAALRTHLSGCPACRDHAAAYRTLLQGAASLPRPQPGDDLAQRVVDAWRQQRSAPAAASHRWAGRAAPLGTAATWLAVAASLVVAVLAWQVVRLSAPRHEAQPIAGQPAPNATTNAAGGTIDPVNAAQSSPPVPVEEPGTPAADRPLRHLAREASQKYRSLAVATRASVADALLIVPGVQPLAPSQRPELPPQANAEVVVADYPTPAVSVDGSGVVPSWIEQVTTGVNAVTGTTAGTLDVLWQVIPSSDEDHRS
jgi:hypothetical protein